MRPQKPAFATCSSVSAVRVTLVPHPAGSRTAVPWTPSPEKLSSRSGSVSSTETAPRAFSRQSGPNSAHNSGGDLTRVRETSNRGIRGGFRPRGEIPCLHFRPLSNAGPGCETDDWGLANQGGCMSLPVADLIDAVGSKNGIPDSVGINSMWVIVAGCLVMFMQAGFAFLEIGFSRGKNAGTVIAKIVTNFSIAGIMYWAVGFAFAFGGGLGHIIGTDGFFLRDFGDPQQAFPIMGLSDATVEAKWFFQFVFCGVSLAIVWGTTLERIKFGVYLIYGVIFSAVIYPLVSGWVFGGGWLQNNVHMQDFAGSTAVHLIGATGAFAGLLLLGPRRGKYGADGKPRAIPGHNMPLFGLGIFILWLGWFGFNPGSTLGALDGRFTEVLIVTQLAACAGVLGGIFTAYFKTKKIDIGMAGNGAIAALVAITAPSGY